MKNCDWQPINGCGYVYDELDPAAVAAYATHHVPGHAVPPPPPPLVTVVRIPDLIAEDRTTPNVAKSRASIEARLIAAGLKLGDYREVTLTDRTPLGVMSMAPAPQPGPAGERPRDTPIDIVNVVSTAPRGGGGGPRFGSTIVPTHGVMPNVKGKKFNLKGGTAEANTALKAAGLTPSKDNVVEVYDPYSPTDEVMYQWPDPTTSVDVNDPTAWRIQVSKGPDPTIAVQPDEQASNRPGIASRLWNSKIV